MIPAHFTISRAVLRTAGATFAAATVMSVAVPDLSAQRRGSARTVVGTNPVEQSLRLAERLELTQEQRDQLEAVRVGMLEQRAAHSAKLMSLQSEIRAGIRERGSIREEFVGIREAAEASRKTLTEQYGGILTDEQKTQLRQMTRRTAWRQGAVRGRTGTDRWRGTRGRPGMDRGRGMPGRPGMDRGRGTRERGQMDRGRGMRGQGQMDRGRDIRGRGQMDRGRGGDRSRGWRSPGGSGA